MQSISLHQALVDTLFDDYKYAVISHNELCLLIYQAYKEKKYKGVPIHRIRQERPDNRAIESAISQLIISHVIQQHKASFSSNVFYFIGGKGEYSEEEIACSITPFGGLSHLSAMAIHGITDRIPSKIYFTAPTDVIWRENYSDLLENRGIKYDIPSFLRLPPIKSGKIFNRVVEVKKTKEIITYSNIRRSPLRITSIGRTFIDMLRSPEKCGGEDHVIDVFINESPKFQKHIIELTHKSGREIDKTRIGFIFDKIINIQDPIIELWKKNQKRGSSKILSPNFPFSPIHDDKWNLSINVEIAQKYI